MSETESLSMTLEGLVSGVVLLVSLTMLVFYYVKWRDNQCGWEIMFVMAVECINYIMALTLPFDILYPEMADGNRFCWFRYVMWAMTCPILIQQIIRVLTESEPNLNTVSKLMVSNILMDLMGATAALYGNLYVKVVALTTAFLLFFGLMYTLVYIWMQNRVNFDERKTARSRRDVLIAMLSTWTIFPVLFMLGPECFKVLSFTQSSALHGVSDLLAKNMVGFTSWKIRNSFRAKKTKEEKKSKKQSLQELKMIQLQNQIDQQNQQNRQSRQEQQGLVLDAVHVHNLQNLEVNDNQSEYGADEQASGSSSPPMSQQEQLQQQLTQMQMQMQMMQQQLQVNGGSPRNGSPRNGSPIQIARSLVNGGGSRSFAQDLGLTPAMYRMEAQDKLDYPSLTSPSVANAAGSPLLNAQKYSSYSPNGSFEPQINQTRSLPPALAGSYKRSGSRSPVRNRPTGQQFTNIMT